MRNIHHQEQRSLIKTQTSSSHETEQALKHNSITSYGPIRKNARRPGALLNTRHGMSKLKKTIM